MSALNPLLNRHAIERSGGSLEWPQFTQRPWGSQAAVMPGSRNIIGIANKAVDALIQQVVFAKNRDELMAATRALDRVLLWNHYVVPQWIYGKVRTARWDRFGKPERMPSYGLSAFPAIWWWDAQRATETASR